MSAAVVAALAVVFLLASEQLAKLWNRARCWWRGSHHWSFYNRIGGTRSCKRCPAVELVPVTDLETWRRLS